MRYKLIAKWNKNAYIYTRSLLLFYWLHHRFIANSCDLVWSHFGVVWLNIHQMFKCSNTKHFEYVFDGYTTLSKWRYSTVFGDIMNTLPIHLLHYSDVIMSTMASQITNLTIVYSNVYTGTDPRKHQSSASLAFVRGIHRSSVNSHHRGPVTQKMFAFDDVIMSEWTCVYTTSGLDHHSNLPANCHSNNLLQTSVDWHQNMKTFFIKIHLKISGKWQIFCSGLQ